VVKIHRLEVENVKRVQAVQVEPTPNGLTIIGGRNGQGKTSVLDAIVWGLGGGKHRPTSPKREDAMADPRIHIEMDNGLIVTRDGKNATLKVVDPHGNKAGQALLDELIGQLAIDLPKFLHASGKEKAETLLQIIGVGEELRRLDHDAETVYNERHAVGQVLARKKKHAEDLPFEQGVPAEEVSASELIQQQQAILARNGENQRKRQERDRLARVADEAAKRVDELHRLLDAANATLDSAKRDLETAAKTAEQLQDESTAELEVSLKRIDETNRKVRSNAEKHRAEEDAAELQEQVDGLTERLETVRRQRRDLLQNASLPLPGLAIDAGELVYHNQKWDCMSGADQLRVAVAIVRQLKPQCQFVLLDKLEQMDAETLAEFGRWLESESLQVIATRVSTGGECSIIIEDGMVAGAVPVAAPPATPLDSEGF